MTNISVVILEGKSPTLKAKNMVSYTSPNSLPLQKSSYIWPQGYITFFMLNSAEHEILNAYK